MRRASVPLIASFAGTDGAALVLETGGGGNGWDAPVRRRRERGLILWKWQGDCAVDRV